MNLNDSTTPDILPKAEKPDGKNISGDGPRKPRLLVVDDDPPLLQVTSYLLSILDVEVIEANTGAQALQLAQTRRPDLFLLDVMLPDLNGLEVCRRIKTNPNLTNIYVILLSAMKTAPAEQALGLEAGADGYISRPFSNQEFLARIRAVLRLKQTETDLREREIRYRQLLDTIPSGVAVYEAVDDGQDFVFRDFNMAGERIDGLKKADILGRRITEVFPALGILAC
jgi:DNA-binding response OmpR family regulator